MKCNSIHLFLAILCSAFIGCNDQTKPAKKTVIAKEHVREMVPALGPELIVLGTFQDAGSPQIGCEKACCEDLFDHPDPERMVVSLGVTDGEGKTYLFEATPDIGRQLQILQEWGGSLKSVPTGVFLTHAHIGHYTGLMYFGKEAMDASNVPVYAMPRMQLFLRANGPWSLLNARKNIELSPIIRNETITLGSIAITPIEVPHRDEFSETVGYRISGPNNTALFIPDIDKWEKWDLDIQSEIKNVDYAFLDATFYSGAEINNRDISQIPHPFIIESMEAFKNLPVSEKRKIQFIHFNHTNPVLDRESVEAKKVIDAGFGIAQLYDTYEL